MRSPARLGFIRLALGVAVLAGGATGRGVEPPGPPGPLVERFEQAQKDVFDARRAGDYDRALAGVEAMRAIAREMGDDGLVYLGGAEKTAARTHDMFRRYEVADAHTELAIELMTKADAPVEAARVHLNHCNALMRRGAPVRADRALAAALDLLDDLDDRHAAFHRCRAETMRSAVAYHLGDLPAMRAHAESAIRGFEGVLGTTADPREMIEAARAYNNLGLALLEISAWRDEPEGTSLRARSREAHEHALRLRKRADAKAYDLAKSWNNLARVAAAEGDFDAASAAADEAWRLVKESRLPGHPNRVSSLVGRAGLAEQRDAREALALLQHALRESESSPPPARRRALLAMASLRLEHPELDAGDGPPVRSLLADAMEIGRQARSDVRGAPLLEARWSAATSFGQGFEAMALLELREGDPTRGFELVEEGRATVVRSALADGGRRGDARPAAPAIPPGLVVLAYVWRPEGVGLVLAKEDLTLGFVLAGTTAEVDRLDEAVDRLAGVMQVPPERRPDRGEALVIPATLARTLVPVEALTHAEAADQILVLAAGPLAAIPLEPLLSAARPAAGEAAARPGWSVAYAPSAGAALTMSSTGADETALRALVVADPLYEDERERLFGTAHEAWAIAGMLERAGGTARVLLGRDATLAAVDRASCDGRWSHIHFAAHAHAGTFLRPELARLRLANRGASGPADLTIDQVTGEWAGRLRGTRLVTLSACDTQRGPSFGSEGAITLAWGFMHSGADAVVASLWKADDTATALLMTRFYENLLGVGDTKRSVAGRPSAGGRRASVADALAEAKRWLRLLPLDDASIAADRLSLNAIERGVTPRAPADAERVRSVRPFEDPHFWAGFVVVGGIDRREHAVP